QPPRNLPHPHSFPTRRSSDLPPAGMSPGAPGMSPVGPAGAPPVGAAAPGAAVTATLTPAASAAPTPEVSSWSSNFIIDNFRKGGDRKSTRLNSSHDQISYAVF